MLRPFHPLDAMRFTMLGGPRRHNRAYTSSGPGAEPLSLWSTIDSPRSRLVPRNRGCAWTWVRGLQIAGMVVARRRSGPRTWDVTHLLLASDDTSQLSGLLSAVSRIVASRGGERVFLKLLADDPAVEEARRSGFVTSYHETLFGCRRRSNPTVSPVSLRAAKPPDEYGLFRLYCAATPREVRSVVGMTLEQWRASRETMPGRSRDYVYEKNDSVKGSVRIFGRFGRGRIAVMVHPDDEPDVAGLLDFGLERLGTRKDIYCAVPEYQVLLHRLLLQRSYEPVSEYVTMVRTTAAAVSIEEARAPATVVSA